MDTGPRRWAYLDFCRTLSMFCVVMIHATAALIYGEPVGGGSWTVHSVYFSVSRFAIPMFFMVSGALLLDPKRELSIKRLYSQRILRLVTALLFWSAMFYIFIRYAQAPSFTWESFDPGLFIRQVVGGHPDHHWFIFVMIALYLAVPILRCITKSRTAIRCFLALWLVLQVLLSSVRLMPVLFPDLPAGLLSIIGAIMNFFGNITPVMLSSFAGYMLLGYYLHANPPGPRARRAIQLAGVLGALFTVASTYVLSTRNGVTSETFYDTNSLWICAMTLAVFLTAKAFFSGIREPGNRVLSTLSGYAFGVYLVHDFFLNYINRMGYSALFPAPLAPLLVTLVVYALSLCVVFLLKRIPVIRDYLC